jgi:hypothetical protein
MLIKELQIKMSKLSLLLIILCVVGCNAFEVLGDQSQNGFESNTFFVSDIRHGNFTGSGSCYHDSTLPFPQMEFFGKSFNDVDSIEFFDGNNLISVSSSGVHLNIVNDENMTVFFQTAVNSLPFSGASTFYLIDIKNRLGQTLDSSYQLVFTASCSAVSINKL